MWFGTTDRDVYRYDGRVVTRFLSDVMVLNAKMLILKDVQQILEDKTRAIWFASWNNKGAYRYDGRKRTNITSREGLSDGMVHSLLQDKTGDIWFGTRDHGPCRYDGKSFKHVTGIEGLSESCVYSILEDKAGVLWFATEKNGVWRYDGKSFTNLTTKDGLGNNSVFCIVEDGEGHLWFGTRDVGLSRYDGKTFISLLPPIRECVRPANLVSTSLITARYERVGSSGPVVNRRKRLRSRLAYNAILIA